MFLKAEEFRSGQDIIKKRVVWVAELVCRFVVSHIVRSWSRCNEKLRDANWTASSMTPFMQNLKPLYTRPFGRSIHTSVYCLSYLSFISKRLSQKAPISFVIFFRPSISLSLSLSLRHSIEYISAAPTGQIYMKLYI